MLSLAGKPRKPFRYVDRGSMATIGRNKAVAQIGRFQFTGFIAWWMWLLVHVLSLVEFRSRISGDLRVGLGLFHLAAQVARDPRGPARAFGSTANGRRDRHRARHAAEFPHQAPRGLSLGLTPQCSHSWHRPPRGW